MMISYLTAFARSRSVQIGFFFLFSIEMFFRRNQEDDRDKALAILERLCSTKKAESALSNDILGLFGRIYKDKFTESNYQDGEALENAIEWYRKGFAADPNI